MDPDYDTKYAIHIAAREGRSMCALSFVLCTTAKLTRW